MVTIVVIAGPYTQPKFGRGGRTFCLYRDCDVKIISWTDAPIPWPRCRPVDSLKGQPGLLVDDELARAIRRAPWQSSSGGVSARTLFGIGGGHSGSLAAAHPAATVSNEWLRLLVQTSSGTCRCRQKSSSN